jgi:hypothetical protein
MDATINTLAQLGGTVFTVIAFLYYLDKNQTKQIDANIKLAVALENLTDIVVKNSNVNTKNTVALDNNTNAMQ